jgi:hypothetical protein
MDPQVPPQPTPQAEQPANVVHVHVGEHHVGQGFETEAGGLQSPGQLPRPCKFRELRP